eukprot:jgi/Tetstr1/444146/TSEL_032044.t1
MIDFACVSSTTTPTWSNDPRWFTPGIAATEAEQSKLAADRASSAPVQGVHRYYPFVVEDRGRLRKSALTVVYIFAVLLAVRNFPGDNGTEEVDTQERALLRASEQFALAEAMAVHSPVTEQEEALPPCCRGTADGDADDKVNDPFDSEDEAEPVSTVMEAVPKLPVAKKPCCGGLSKPSAAGRMPLTIGAAVAVAGAVGAGLLARKLMRGRRHPSSAADAGKAAKPERAPSAPTVDNTPPAQSKAATGTVAAKAPAAPTSAAPKPRHEKVPPVSVPTPATKTDTPAPKASASAPKATPASTSKAGAPVSTAAAPAPEAAAAKFDPLADYGVLEDDSVPAPAAAEAVEVPRAAANELQPQEEAKEEEVVSYPPSDNAWEAASVGDLASMRAHLEASGGRVDAQDEEGCSCLWLAANQGHARAVSWLIEAGADVNLKDAEGVSPLFTAANQGRLEVVVALLSAPKVDVNARNAAGQSALWTAANLGHAQVVAALLAHPGVDPVCADTGGRTPLHAAANPGK